MEMVDISCDGEFQLPRPTTHTSEEMLANGPVTVFAEPTAAANADGSASDDSSVPADGSKSGSIWVEVPNAPGLPKDVKVVWHYTDSAGLIGILTSGTLRAAALPTLNDSAEYMYGREILERIMPLIRDSRYVHPIQKTYIEQIVSLADSLSQRPGLFVLCASEAEHSLAQWRAYGRGQGHALLLDPRGPLAILSPEEAAYSIDSLNHSWKRVIYKPTEQQEFIVRTLGFLAGHAPHDATAVSSERESDRSSAMVLVSALAHCKEPSFSEEREVRIVVRAPSLAAIKFRSGPTGVSPYLELSGASNDGERTRNEPGLLPVDAVIVGPFAARKASGEGVITLLDAAGYPKAWVGASNSTLR